MKRGTFVTIRVSEDQANAIESALRLRAESAAENGDVSEEIRFEGARGRVQTGLARFRGEPLDRLGRPFSVVGYQKHSGKDRR